MKLALLTIILSIIATASAASNSGGAIDEGELSEDDGKCLVGPKIDQWEYIPDSSPVEIEPTPPTQLAWSIISFLGSFLTSAPVAAPIKKLTANPEVKSVQSAESFESVVSGLIESDADYLVSIFNCERRALIDYDVSILQAIASLKELKKSAILAHLTEIGNKSLFEMFFDTNLGTILGEVVSSRDFHIIVFNCIKIKSMPCFYNAMLNRPRRYSLNAPQAVVVAAMSGSEDILQFVLNQQSSLDYAWEWRSFDGGDGFMLNFGSDPFSASLLFGGLKAISGGHIDCLNIIISRGLDATYNDFLLLKESTATKNIDIFRLMLSISSDRNPIPIIVMKDILLLAIKHDNVPLVDHLLSLKIKYGLKFEIHLSSAIITKNKEIFDLIIQRLPSSGINSKILSEAAFAGNPEILIALLKLSSTELVFSSLSSCISNPKYNYLVQPITSALELNSEIITQALVLSVKVQSVELVRIFLRLETCNNLAVRPGFVEALYLNNVDILNEFFEVSTLNYNSFIRAKDIPAVLNTIFELKAWNTLFIFIQKYFSNSDFPKHYFITIIVETDQVEIVRFIATNGASFSKTLLPGIKNREIHALVQKAVMDDCIGKKTK